MIISNRKLKLIIISLLFLIFSYFLGIFNVNAMPITDFSNIQNYQSNSQCVGTRSVGTSTREVIISPIYSSGGCTLNNNITPDADYIIIPIILYSSEWANHTSGDTQTYEVLSNSVQVWLNTLGGDIFCDYDGLYATCPFKIANAQRLININILYSKGNGPSSAIYYRIANDWLIANSKSSTINNIQNNTNDIKNSINDSNIDSNNASSSASSWNSKNATNGTITNLLTLPITLLQAIVNGLQTSCSSFSLGSLFGTNITLPCINISNLIGSGLFTIIDILFSGFMILSISKKMIKIFNDFTNLKSNQIDELYGGGN